MCDASENNLRRAFRFEVGKSIIYAYKLARETIVSEIIIPVNPPKRAKATRKTTCNICLDGDINANEMFCVDKYSHDFVPSV